MGIPTNFPPKTNKLASTDKTIIWANIAWFTGFSFAELSWRQRPGIVLRVSDSTNQHSAKAKNRDDRTRGQYPRRLIRNAKPGQTEKNHRERDSRYNVAIMPHGRN